SPDNEHLLDLAVKIFIELVQSQEYTGIDHVDEETIRNSIYLHVTQRLRRRFREENKWEDTQRAAHAKNLRRHSRLTNVSHSPKHPGSSVKPIPKTFGVGSNCQGMLQR
ncbi:hypothetical protein VP01_15095g1, partial [Puccinia sorghi]